MRTMPLFALLLAGSGCAAQAPPDLGAQLAAVKRVYVDRFEGGESAARIRDMLIASLQRAGVFVITENPERGDAVLRGSAEELVFTDVFQSSETMGAQSRIGAGRGTSTRSRTYAALGAGVSDGEQTRIQERKHEASASVRIVAKDGDVIWSTTEESQGGKFRSAGADVADKITRQLLNDLGKRKPVATTAAPDR